MNNNMNNLTIILILHRRC